MNEKKINLIILISLTTYILLVALPFLNNPYLWLDEAGQFWLSLGLNHDSGINDAKENILSALINNRHYCLDPGSYTAFTFLITKISTNHFWLKISSMIFILLSIFFNFSYFKRYKTNKLLTYLTIIFLVVLPFSFKNIFHSSYEFRSYAMEIFAISFSIFYLKQDVFKKKISEVILLTFALSFLCCARYSSLIFLDIFYIYLIFYFPFNKKTNSRKFLAGLIILLFNFVVFFNSYIFQNPEGSELYYLNYLSLSTIYLLDFNNLTYLTYILCSIIIYFNGNRKNLVLTEINLIVFIAFVSLSLIGKFPLDLNSTRSNVILYMSLLSCSELIILFISKNQNIILRTLILILIALLFFYKINSYYFYDNSNNTINFIKENSNNKINVLVDRSQSPSIKYLLKYGSISKLENEISFHFLSYKKHSEAMSKDTLVRYYQEQVVNKIDISEYDFIIGPELINFINTESLIDIYNNNYIFKVQNKDQDQKQN